MLWLPEEARDFLLRQCVKPGCGVHPFSYSVGAGHFPVGEAARYEYGHKPPVCIRITDDWIHASAPPHEQGEVYVFNVLIYWTALTSSNADVLE